MTLLLAVKLFASPLLIGLASLAGKRWGPNAAGLVGGLPLVAAPIVVAIWLADGAATATQVSRAAPVGVWATIVYLLTLGHASARWNWYVAIPLGWALYLLAAFALDAAGVAQSLLLSLAVIPALWFAATRLLPRPSAHAHPARLPHAELLARMAAAVAIMLALTSAADVLGPEMTGVLSGGPVAATVIPAFIMATATRDALLLALRGFLTGLIGFTVFFLILGYAPPAWGWLALLPSLVAAVATGLMATQLVRRRMVIPAPA